MPSDFWWKKRVLSLWVITFDPLKKEKKNTNWKKNCLFHQKSEVILHLLFAGIACKIYFLMPSNFDEKMPLDYDKFWPSENDGIYSNQG